MKNALRPALLAGALLLAAAPSAAQRGDAAPRASSYELKGRLTLAAGRRQAVSPDEISQAVVYFLPAAGAAKPAPRRFTAVTYTKGFEPNLVVAPVGSTVSFPNRDTILHNVFSATPGAAFDLGSYGPGETRVQRFDRAGLVVVSCNVHRGMRLNVLALETPHVAQPGADGAFSLPGLPRGAGTLVVWHPRAAAVSVQLDGRATPFLEKTLVATRPRIGSN